MEYSKEIIIDGVNVAGCENYKPKHRFTCHPHICNCHQRKDCYYKQLQRKEQECERLQAENEELKEKLDNIQDDCPSFGDCSYVQCAKDERDRHKQALKSIKAETKWVVDNRECYDLRDADRCQRILTIINEVLRDE